MVFNSSQVKNIFIATFFALSDDTAGTTLNEVQRLEN